MQIEIIAVSFDQISKQQVNLSLFLSDRYCQELGLTDLPGHNEKVTSNKKMIRNSYQRYNGRNRVYWTHFSVIFEIKGKSLIVFVRLVLEKWGLKGLPGLDKKLMPDLNLN